MSKSIKANARTVAAPKADKALDAANHAIKALADQYRTRVSGAVGKMQLEYALKARDILADQPEADVKPLLSAFGKQRKSEAQAVCYASDADLAAAFDMVPGKGKPGLQQTGRALKLVYAGNVVDDAAAKRFINNGKADDFKLATGQPIEAPKPEPKKGAQNGGADEPDHKRDVALPIPAAEDVGNIKRLADLEAEYAALLPALEAELAAFGPGTRKALASFLKVREANHKAAEALIAAAANG